MKELELNIIRRKRLDRSAVIYGFIAAILLIGAVIQYLRFGKVRVLEELSRQLGILDWLGILTLFFFIFFSIVMLRGIRTIARKKKEIGGTLKIDSDKLQIHKRNQQFELSGTELQQITFELQSPQETHQLLSGGNWVKIPSPDGIYKCEFDICDQQTFDVLNKYLQHYEHVHNVHITTLVD